MYEKKEEKKSGLIAHLLKLSSPTIAPPRPLASAVCVMVDARGGGALLPRWVPPFDLHSLSRRAIKKLFQLLLSSSTLHDCTDRDKDYLREAIARVHLTAGGSTTRDERIGLGGFRRVRRARSFSRGIAVGIRAPDTRGVVSSFTFGVRNVTLAS